MENYWTEEEVEDDEGWVDSDGNPDPDPPIEPDPTPEPEPESTSRFEDGGNGTCDDPGDVADTPSEVEIETPEESEPTNGEDK